MPSSVGSTDEKGINIDGEYLSRVIFADDVVLIAQSPQELHGKLSDIHNFSRPVGLNMQLGETKVMLNNDTNKATVTVDGTVVEEVYLGKTVTRNGDLMPEIKRHIALGWAAFGKGSNIMRSQKTGTKIKRKVLSEYVIPVMTRGSGTWAPTTVQMKALTVARKRSGLYWA